MVVALRLLHLALLILIVAGPLVSAIAAEEVLRIDTRFGPVIVRKIVGDCCRGIVQFRDQKIDILSAGDIYASREGLFQTAEGDLLVLSIPTGARGMPPIYLVLLVNAAKLIDITVKDFGSVDGTFAARQRGNEVEFDLGWENRKRKSAFYRAGVIYVGSDNVRPAAPLGRGDCTYVLNRLADCRKTCPADDFMGLAVQRSFAALEQKLAFRSDNFFKICKENCKGAAFSTSAARAQLCGY